MWAFRPSSPGCSRSTPLRPRSLRIELTRSGGFAGLTTHVGKLDTAELPDDDARAVERLYRDADLSRLTRGAPSPGGGADRFQYHLTVEDDDGRRELTMREDEVPEGLRPLFERVRAAGEG
jgi:hypothetical protein